MKILVVIFGGADYEVMSELNLSSLPQETVGRASATDLWKNQDTATQITSQLLTGTIWEQSGVRGRKKYTVEPIDRIEKLLQRRLDEGLSGWIEGITRPFRLGLYRTLLATRGYRLDSRNYLASDLNVATLFEMVENSKSLYVPAYDPEPSWAIRRNILNPERFPELGHEGAIDLAEKNFEWRRSRFLSLADDSYDLLVTQFQYLDSLQHLHLWRTDPPDWERVHEAYHRMDELAGTIKAEFDQYDLTLFLSDNGVPASGPGRTHMDRPFYSVDKEFDLADTRIIDFHYHIKEWLRSSPNPVTLHD